ncbi:AAA family ATPase [Caldimonas tepidiphila]|uniref:AAA family ATPase n=1 Tax=Caldimonas tepidiphila TaxID=2315841 RepID=UPI000E5B59DC|nr:AAA family ATPase [Caldimonas tepidiphila]
MEAIILIGIQASGKTSFYRERFFDTHLRLSLDMLRTRHRLHLLLQACLAAKQPFVLDNTQVLRQERLGPIAQARAAGFSVQGYFFEPRPERALAWNAQRAGRALIPPKGLLGTLKRLERPTPEEGYDRLWRVEIDAAGAFVVAPWQPPP